MPWRGRRGKICKCCGGHVADVGRLSARYKCRPCSIGLVTANITDLHHHRGPYFEHWRRAMVACVGGVLVDDVGEPD